MKGGVAELGIYAKTIKENRRRRERNDSDNCWILGGYTKMGTDQQSLINQK